MRLFYAQACINNITQGLLPHILFKLKVINSSFFEFNIIRKWNRVCKNSS